MQLEDSFTSFAMLDNLVESICPAAACLVAFFHLQQLIQLYGCDKFKYILQRS